MTIDNVAVKVSAVVYFSISDPQASLVKVEDVHYATSQLMQTELRDVLCKRSFSEILSERNHLSSEIKERAERITNEWGVNIDQIQMKEVDLIDPDMVRALAKEAEATREKTAAMIRASGELESAKILANAAKLFETTPMSMELRRLQSLEKIAKEKSQTTVVVPMGLGTETAIGLSAASASNSGKILKDIEDSNE
eukprot:TRINITY_DN8992_c0_g1_i2.p1 TRINITY_DN8992_c0_g1~~TRINITY_DN8992_c0_g1_i2.p1  ORF type:complete len:196 (-),score=53.36 TRINITY_DN8992_c0_g1_i2:48-635(-)